MPVYTAAPASKEALTELAGALEAFDDAWEALQAQAAEKLQEICQVRARSRYLMGDWKGLEALDREINVRGHFADKLRDLEDIALQQCLHQLGRMREAILRFDTKTRFLYEHIAQFRPAAPGALPAAAYTGVQRAADAVAALMTCYAHDLMCKEVIARSAVEDDAPTDGERLRLQQHAFTCQGYVPQATVVRTRELVHAAAALFK